MTHPWEALCSPAVEPESSFGVVPASAVSPAVTSPGRRRPVTFKKADALVLGWLVASVVTLVTAVTLASPHRPFDCHSYAEHQAELRNLTKKERIEVQRSCGVSKIWELDTQAEARAVAVRLNQSKKRMCITPAYVGNDGSDWIAFCPQL